MFFAVLFIVMGGLTINHFNDKAEQKTNSPHVAAAEVTPVKEAN
jgi:hypothetical protein